MEILDIKLHIGSTGTESESPDTLSQIPKGFSPQTIKDKAAKKWTKDHQANGSQCQTLSGLTLINYCMFSGSD